jgi:hypothetical protein
MRSCLELKQRSGATPAPMRLLYLTGRKKQMLLDTWTMLGIIIALASSCFVMVISIRAHGQLLRENKRLRMELTELHYEKVKGGN